MSCKCPINRIVQYITFRHWLPSPWDPSVWLQACVPFYCRESCHRTEGGQLSYTCHSSTGRTGVVYRVWILWVELICTGFSVRRYFFFSRINTQRWDCRAIWYVYVQVFKKLPNCLTIVYCLYILFGDIYMFKSLVHFKNWVACFLII